MAILDTQDSGGRKVETILYIEFSREWIYGRDIFTWLFQLFYVKSIFNSEWFNIDLLSLKQF